MANVSHELRTPLSIITGYLETLIEGGGDQETNLRFLRTMHKHAQRLNLLIEDLLAISQLESRKISLHFEPVDLRRKIQPSSRTTGFAYSRDRCVGDDQHSEASATNRGRRVPNRAGALQPGGQRA